LYYWERQQRQGVSPVNLQSFVLILACGLQIVGTDTFSIRSVLDALEARYPVLRGTIRDHGTLRRRPFVRFFACQEDLSLEPPEAGLPDEVVAGVEPFLIVGAIAGG